MELEKMTKNQLLTVIGKMKKKDIVNMLTNNKLGGSNDDKNVIKETPHSIRKPIVYNSKKLNGNNYVEAFKNDQKYNNIYTIAIEPNKNVV